MNQPIQPLVMLDIEGTSLTADDKALLQHPAVGGVIFFSRNIEDRIQLCGLSSEIRRLRPDLLQAVDQEGGRVQRLKDGVTTLPPMGRIRDVFEGDAAKLASYCIGRLMASEVTACGLDLSFAPVLDIDFDRSGVIGDRSFSTDADEVVSLAGSFIQGMEAAGMAATGKHFPGHGYVKADSHLAIPHDSRTKDAIWSQDLLPFRQLAPLLRGIMPAHVIYDAIDDQPAGFSPYWLQSVLRDELKFNGLIFSDDLSMEGARAAGSHAEAANAALQAGCDMVLVCNDRSAAIKVVDAVESLCAAGKIPQKVPASSLLAEPGKAMDPHEYYEAEAYARLATEEDSP